MALPPQKSPEVPQSGTHHHPLPLTPALTHPATSHSPLLTRRQIFFFFFDWGGGPDTLTPSYPSLGLLAVTLVSSDLRCPLGYSSLPLPLHGDAPKVSGTFFFCGGGRGG